MQVTLAAKLEDGEDAAASRNPNSITKVACFSALAFVLPAIATADASAKVAEKTRKKPKVPKNVPTMPLEERRNWTKGLPRIEESIPYTEILELREANKVKYIIKHPNTRLKETPEKVFVVLDDDRVVRAVLPTPDRDERFWTLWNDMELNSVMIDAFTPAPPVPELQGWAAKGPSLTFLWKIQSWFNKSKTEGSRGKKRPSAARSRLEELERTRKEMEREGKERETEARKQEAERRREQKAARARAIAEKAQREREMKDEVTRTREAAAKEVKFQQQVQDRAEWNSFFYSASRNEGFRFLMGIFFFWLFYQTVVVGVKKRKQDYDDRVKIEQAEEEDRRKMREWESEMEAAEVVFFLAYTSYKIVWFPLPLTFQFCLHGGWVKFIPRKYVRGLLFPC